MNYFSLGVTAEALRANIGSKSVISLYRGPDDPKFQIEGVAPTNHFFHKTRINDWRTNILIARLCLHSMQSGKNREKRSAINVQSSVYDERSWDLDSDHRWHEYFTQLSSQFMWIDDVDLSQKYYSKFLSDIL